MSIINEKSKKLILDFEVGGGERYYNKFLSRPTVPGGSSTITIGIGIDLGFYTKKEFEKMFKDKIDSSDYEQLKESVGMSRKQALQYLPTVKDIVIPWDVAYSVFEEITIKSFFNKCVSAFPGFESLNQNAQGGIISIAFNRGTSIKGDKRKEILEIKNLIPKKDYRGIAKQNRLSIRIWKGTDIDAGMTRRRLAESELIESPV